MMNENKKRFELWCIENDKKITEIYKTILHFLDHDVIYNYPIRNIQIDRERLYLES